jgi:flavin reductase (DIM6/NTAB) family NADH-FMN oxidoreductase RutF
MVLKFDVEELSKMTRIYRSNFINSLSGFKSVSLIGTANADGLPNLGVFSNIVHIGADPAVIGFINRPRIAAPHTIANIESTGSYTINHIHPLIVSAAHQTSAKYDEGISEFEQTGLTAEFKEGTHAPFVKESKVKYSLEYIETIAIQYNGTFLVIGKIKEIFIDDQLILDDGYLDLQKAESMTSLGLDGYYTVKEGIRFPYAKP